MMPAHYHGQTINYSELGRSFGASDNTILNYLDILESTFMIRQLSTALMFYPKLGPSREGFAVESIIRSHTLGANCTIVCGVTIGRYAIRRITGPLQRKRPPASVEEDKHAFSEALIRRRCTLPEPHPQWAIDKESE